MSKKTLKVGFDLDGVILYNPIRIFRPVASFLKPFFFGKKKIGKKSYYFPDSGIEKTLWRILHKTSFTPAKGLDLIKQLSEDNKIEAYIITGRYKFLEKDFVKWLKVIKAKTFVKKSIFNIENKQPHIFKEEMIKKLGLDIFVEDNWGIVKYLSKKPLKTKILWINNIFDRPIDYKHKFTSLKKTVEYIKSLF